MGITVLNQRGNRIKRFHDMTQGNDNEKKSAFADKAVECGAPEIRRMEIVTWLSDKIR